MLLFWGVIVLPLMPLNMGDDVIIRLSDSE